MKSIKYDENIESLRGFAAISVVWAHVFGFNNLLATNYHPSGYWAYFNAGHPSVLIFFLLSGYVIGITNKNVFSSAISLQYLKKRAIRLFPIYILTIIFTLSVVPEYDTLKIIGNLFFLQTLLVDVLKGNTILWTLNNEVIYYVLFILVICFKPNLKYLIISCFIFSIIFSFSILNTEIINRYLIGWIFWLIGLYCAWNMPKNDGLPNYYLILPLILIIIATNLYNPGAMLSGFLNLKTKGINLEADLFYFPVTFCLFITVANRKISNLNFLYVICWAIPILVATALLFKGRLFENQSWQVANLFILLSFAFLMIKIKQNFIRKLSFLGSISYAIYVFHMPLLHLFNKLYIYNSTEFYFWLTILFFGILLFTLSYLAELVLQPFIKRKLQNA